MKINLHIPLAGTSPLKRKVKIDAPEGATVEEIVNLYMQKFNANDVLNHKIGVSILINGSRGGFQHKLKDNDRVEVFKPRIHG